MTSVTQNDAVKWLVLEPTILWLDENSATVDTGTGTDDTTRTGGEADKPFLQVNERTSYKTAEEAKKGYEEAQKTITSLSGYRKVLEELGAPENADAAYLKGVLTDYLRLAAEAKAAKDAAASKKTTSSEEDKEFEGVDPQIVAQTKRGRQWLKDNAEKVGLISQEKYDKLVKDFEEFKGGFTQQAQEEHAAVVEEGQQKVTEWLGEAKVTLDDPDRLKLENLIVAYISSDRAITNKWLRADRPSKINMIREGYEMFLPIVKPGAAPVAKAANTAAAGKTKIGLMNRTKTLPQGGSGSEDKGGNKKPLRIGDPSLRAKALEMIKNLDAESNAAGE